MIKQRAQPFGKARIELFDYSYLSPSPVEELTGRVRQVIQRTEPVEVLHV
jgi:hypothetical protein